MTFTWRWEVREVCGGYVLHNPNGEIIAEYSVLSEAIDGAFAQGAPEVCVFCKYLRRLAWYRP